MSNMVLIDTTWGEKGIKSVNVDEHDQNDHQSLHLDLNRYVLLVQFDQRDLDEQKIEYSDLELVKK